MRRVLNFGFLLVFFLVSFFYNQKLKNDIKKAEEKIRYELELKKTQKSPYEKPENIKVYYPNENLSKMLITNVGIKNEIDRKDKFNNILKIIKEKTKDKVYYAKDKKMEFIPENLEIENIYLDKGELYVDFNMDFRHYMLTKEHEVFFTYSIVNSFIGLEDIRKIKFLILGKEIKELKFYKIEDFLFKYEKI